MARDRKDGRLLRNIDSMHFICPIIYPNRCDNEAFISEIIDVTNIEKYLEKKNKDNNGYHYSIFQLITTAMLKVLYLRPKMNYFIANSNLYERNEITASFVVKKEFDDNGGEGLAFIHSKPTDNFDSIHKTIESIVFDQRGGGSDSSTDNMDFFNSLPRSLSKFLVRRVMWLDKHGLVPQSLIDSDPYYSSVVLTNLGSIDLHSGYHHLTNWGTNSIFLTVGEVKERPFINEGETVMKKSIDLGMTIDERIADGYYYSKTVKLLKYILENPEILDSELSSSVNFE